MLDHISAPSLYDPNKIVADIDLALELQLDDNQLYPIRSHPPDKPTKVRYTAYHSPLEQFKDFRYHPNYASIVPGGFKSLTYNHKINPDTPLCPYEASGGRCNDPNCNFQHFANMGFTDNELIRILGTEYGNHHEEIRNEFNRGLAAIVNELKASSLSRDVNAIAQRIVNFRRGFLGDPSRVLDFEWWDKKYGSKQEEEVAQ
ncbi:hypothetical protein K431DRAFT_215909 [Polychaeton citri CBS 116435]|uniref:C3H1-type domain-containing protein n=1 Tax=Polychaeton citri CBS 116435 TaxID=1314669 RepID=A0A9P4QI86_9PEZI|nr:hypothetical protein K431DRAFT_215909 [Polychaeton citri CBS 116435]